MQCESKGPHRGFGTREVEERPGPPHLCRLLDRRANGFHRNVESLIFRATHTLAGL